MLMLLGCWRAHPAPGRLWTVLLDAVLAHCPGSRGMIMVSFFSHCKCAEYICCSGKAAFHSSAEDGPRRWLRKRKLNIIKIFQPRSPFTWRLQTQTSGGVT